MSLTLRCLRRWATCRTASGCRGNGTLRRVDVTFDARVSNRARMIGKLTITLRGTMSRRKWATLRRGMMWCMMTMMAEKKRRRGRMKILLHSTTTWREKSKDYIGGPATELCRERQQRLAPYLKPMTMLSSTEHHHHHQRFWTTFFRTRRRARSPHSYEHVRVVCTYSLRRRNITFDDAVYEWEDGHRGIKNVTGGPREF
jgi:hypothetical protein